MSRGRLASRTGRGDGRNSGAGGNGSLTCASGRSGGRDRGRIAQNGWGVVQHWRGVFAATALVFFAGFTGARGVAGSVERNYKTNFRSAGGWRRLRLRERFVEDFRDGIDSFEATVSQLKIGVGGEVLDDIAEADERGIPLIKPGLREKFVAELPFGLEFAEFGDAFEEEAVGLVAGAIHGELGGAGVFGSEEIGLNDAAAAESPRCVDRFAGDGFFDGAFGIELVVEDLDEAGVFRFFAWFDVIVGGEEAQGGGIGGGTGFTFRRAGT